MTRAVLALHPSLAHGGAFSALAGHLPDLQIVAPDMIGHGQGAPWDGQSDYFNACTRAAIGQAESLAAQHGAPIDVLGHSFGGVVALRIALERPELLRRMVLIEPVLFAAARADGAPEYRAYAAEHALFDALLAQGDLDAAAEAFLRHWGDGRPFSSLPLAARAYIRHRLPLVAAQSAGLMQDTGALMGYLRLESCPIPTLLLRGTASPPIIAAIARALLQRLPNAQEVILRGAGHMAPLTHAALCAPAIAAHFAP